MSHVLFVREALMQMRPGDWHVNAVLCFVDYAELGSWITLVLQPVSLEVSSAGGQTVRLSTQDPQSGYHTGYANNQNALMAA
jgi:hypothetical protein